MEAELRGLRPEERGEAIALWVEVFGDESGEYFARYFEADPEPGTHERGEWVADADCHVAVADGRLVSAVHVCRRRLLWSRGDSELLCGAVANVATRPEYRRRGLSRALLRRSVAAMEQDGFAFSMLLTGSFSHYAAVGWEATPVPHRAVSLFPDPPEPEQPVHVLPPVPIPAVARSLYDTLPLRPLHLRRTAPHWDGWVARYWQPSGEAALLLAGPPGDETGYAVLLARPHRKSTRVHELRARDAAAEDDLLRAAARWAVERGHETLYLSFVPQHLAEGDLAAIGGVAGVWDEGLMLRSVRLPSAEMARVRNAYTTGAAQLWWADDF
jgi:GNAT superfamily N-acetyltransferase